jgi:trimethylamine--corrinoid protein Co-methyltransferase
MIDAVKVLDDNQIQAIHSASLQILQKAGMKLDSEYYLMLLHKNGFEIDKRKRIVRMPEALVGEMLKKSPTHFTLYSVDRKNDLQMGERKGYLSTAGTASDIIDFETGARRFATLEDVRSSTKIIDSVAALKVIYSPISANDAPEGTRVIHEYEATVKNTAKHVHLVDLYSSYEAKYVLQIASELVGGVDVLVEKPVVSDMFCVISPLTIDEKALRTVLVFAERGLPISSVSMPLAGGTGPATAAGTVALSNAEVIGALAIIESLCPKTPVIYTPVPALMNPRTGSVGRSPVTVWMDLAAAQIAVHYHLPCSMPSGGSDRMVRDIEAGYEIGTSAVLSRLAGADILTGAGLVDRSTALVLDKLITDAEIHDYVNSVLSEQQVDEETLATDLVVKVGPRGHFLSERHTRMYVHKLWNQHMHDGERDSVAEQAKKKVRDILGTPRPSWLDSSVEKRIHNIVHEAQKNYRQQ